MAEGTGDSAERVKRILPLLLMNWSSRFGVNDGPIPSIAVSAVFDKYTCLVTFGFRREKYDVIKGSLPMLK